MRNLKVITVAHFRGHNLKIIMTTVIKVKGAFSELAGWDLPEYIVTSYVVWKMDKGCHIWSIIIVPEMNISTQKLYLTSKVLKFKAIFLVYTEWYLCNSIFGICYIRNNLNGLS